LNVRNGWKYDDVKNGDRITVVVHPARDANVHSGIMRRITLADGRTILGPREFLTVPTEAELKLTPFQAVISLGLQPSMHSRSVQKGHDGL
jgi:hypothetical protein